MPTQTCPQIKEMYSKLCENIIERHQLLLTIDNIKDLDDFEQNIAQCRKVFFQLSYSANISRDFVKHCMNVMYHNLTYIGNSDKNFHWNVTDNLGAKRLFNPATETISTNFEFITSWCDVNGYWAIRDIDMKWRLYNPETGNLTKEFKFIDVNASDKNGYWHVADENNIHFFYNPDKSLTSGKFKHFISYPDVNGFWPIEIDYGHALYNPSTGTITNKFNKIYSHDINGFWKVRDGLKDLLYLYNPSTGELSEKFFSIGFRDINGFWSIVKSNDYKRVLYNPYANKKIEFLDICDKEYFVESIYEADGYWPVRNEHDKYFLYNPTTNKRSIDFTYGEYSVPIGNGNWSFQDEDGNTKIYNVNSDTLTDDN